MFRVLCLLLVLIFSSTASSSTLKVPYQHFYRSSNADDAYVTKSGCSIVYWKGSDPNGIVSYPHVTKIECKDHATFRSDGVLSDGQIRFYLQSGVMNINNETLDTMGESYWSQSGSRVRFEVKGSILAIGGSLPTQAAVEAELSCIEMGWPCYCLQRRAKVTSPTQAELAYRDGAAAYRYTRTAYRDTRAA